MFFTPCHPWHYSAAGAAKPGFPSRGPQLLADECVTLEAVEHTPRERLERAWDVLKDAAFSGAVCSPP